MAPDKVNGSSYPREVVRGRRAQGGRSFRIADDGANSLDVTRPVSFHHRQSNQTISDVKSPGWYDDSLDKNLRTFKNEVL